MALDFALALEIHVAKIFLKYILERYSRFTRMIVSVDCSTHHAEVLLLLLLVCPGLALLVEAVLGLDMPQVFVLLGLTLASATLILGL